MRDFLSPLGFLEFADLNAVYPKDANGKSLEDMIIETFAVSSIDMLYRQLATDAEKGKRVNNFLDTKREIIKEMKINTILIQGNDINQEGVILAIAEGIYQARGNIKKLEVQNFDDGSAYAIRIVINGLDDQEQIALKNKLIKDSRFKDVLMV